jgi:(4-(4-[2-(gamma-L-glutamylamino)ethyl]phenoxymethyl)furan-2-yl)methanamine synthase
MNAVLGLDIVGANLKAAHVNGVACTRPFALWKDPNGLPEALHNLLRAMPDADTLAVTMTGELCDCFETKRQGVHHILDAVEAVAVKRRVCVFRTDGALADLTGARAEPLLVAAANWLALATHVGNGFARDGAALLIDIGSTTTDIVPLWNGRPIPAGRTDKDRLRNGELVYVGVRRTPLCALLPDSRAAEFFATSLDACLLHGLVAQDEMDCDTADGRPATQSAAHARLARMVCADVETCTFEESREIASAALRAMTNTLTEAVAVVARRLQGKPRTVVLAGSGEFLAWRVLDTQTSFPPPTVITLSQRLGPEVSKAACAYAVAMLAKERRDAL